MMEDSYAELVRKSEKYKTDKTNKYKEVSKDRLLKISKKKIQTTMIGALSTIEKHFGFLWGHVKQLFDEVRSEILDRGNNQARNLEAEFNHYEINWLRYQITLPVKDIATIKEEENGEEQEN